MKLLVIGTDASIFENNSAARRRIDAYARLFDELHIIIYTAPGFRRETTSGGAVLYPTNSRFVFLRPLDAVHIGLSVIRERGISCVSVQDPAESGLAGWLLKRKTGLRLHVQLHTDIASPFFRRNSWKERVRWWLARWIIPRGDGFRVVSRRIRDSLVSRFRIPSSRITVLPIFVDCRKIAAAAPLFRLRERYPRFDYIVLIASRFVREKNIGLALAAFREMRIRFPRTGLVVAGAGPEEQRLKSEVERLELTESVRFEGWLHDLASYLKTADLFLLTSNFEGYSMSVVEAAAAGLPVVMTDVGVAGDLIRDGETGWVVPVGDAHAVARALVAARERPGEARARAESARGLVLSSPPLTWPEYLTRYREAYENFLRH